MTITGIICEYNPMHHGHIQHIKSTRKTTGEDCAVVCVMSGNFVQRGGFSIFGKHARAEAAVMCGADLVVELPGPYALSSSESFSEAGVYLLKNLGARRISFGSESGDIGKLRAAAEAIMSEEANDSIKKWMNKGCSYAVSCQKAAEHIMGDGAFIFKTPNNLLGIEYMKAIISQGCDIKPITVKRQGGDHDGETGYSSSLVRKMIQQGEAAWHYMPEEASVIYNNEIIAGRGPVLISNAENAILSRLRFCKEEDYAAASGGRDGFYRRVMQYALTEPTVDLIVRKAKTKRYVMSRIRRFLLCVCLGITVDDIKQAPPYIRVLAMNEIGMNVLKAAKKTSEIPIITKPVSVGKLSERAEYMLKKEAKATDFYALAYPAAENRGGGEEWRVSPKIIHRA